MRLGVRANEALVVTVLTFLAVATTSTIQMFQLSRIVVQESLEKTDLIARQIYAQMRSVLARAGRQTAAEALRGDPDLASLIDASLAYSPHVVYVLIADEDGQPILHSEPAKEAVPAPVRSPLTALLTLDPVRRVLALYENGRIDEVVLPVQLDDRPFGTIRLGVSTALVRRELNTALVRSAAVAGLALLVAWAVAMARARVILAPIRALTVHVGRLREGSAPLSGELVRGDEVGQLAAQIQQLGERMQSDRVVAAGEQVRVQQVVDHLEDGIVFLNEAGQPLFANRAAEALVGAPISEALVGRAQDIGGVQPLRAAIETALVQQSGFRNTSVTLTVEGRIRELLVSLFIVKDGQRPMGAMMVLRDLGSCKTIQSLLTYSTKLAALGRLTSGVAHEVKNPINAMTIHLEVVRQRLANGRSDVQQSLDIIASEIRRLDHLVQGFLKFVRPQELQLKPIDLNALLQEAAALLEVESRDHGVRFDLQLASGIPPLSADGDLLRQAFLNLIRNACQAMPSGGALRITTDHAGDVVTASVSDEGVGIPAEDLERIFTLYFTTKADGNGLGLPMAYRVVQLHDGTIDVVSEVGRGTTVTVRLPVTLDAS